MPNGRKKGEEEGVIVMKNELATRIIENPKLMNYEKASLLFDVARNDEDIEVGRKVVSICNKGIAKWTKHSRLSRSRGKEVGEQLGIDRAMKYNALLREVLLWLAHNDFDSFMLYIELERPPKERFYAPRRRVLKPIVEALQELVDDKLDELFLSQPARTGKTTLIVFFFVWVMCRQPERSNLYSASAGTITNSFYKAVKEILEDHHTYQVSDVFPETCNIASTNAKETTIDLVRQKHYATLTCRAIDAQLNGSCDCDNILASDDLCSGIEEAMNTERLNSLWAKVDNDLLKRAKGQAKRLWIGTRWSIHDPAGRRMRLLEDNPNFSSIRYKIVNIPALNENDESNFDYLYGVGFNTAHYRQVRASFEANNDMASWLAQCQGEPIERQGTVFDVNDLKFYNGELPEEKPDRIFAYCDCAFGGGDFTSMPIAYQYGERIFIHDVVFTKAQKAISQPKVVAKLIENNVKSVEFEYNNGGEDYSARIDDLLSEKDYKCNVTGRYANTHKKKEFRIYENSHIIRTFFFLDTHHRTKEYNMFMQQLLSFTETGKNKHDDAPDSLAGLAEMTFLFTDGNVRIINRFL